MKSSVSSPKAEKSILLVTSDWEELIYLSHRVIVLSEQKIVGEIEDDITEAAILHLAETTHEPKAKRRRQEADRPEQLYNRAFANTDSNFLVLVFILLAAWSSARQSIRSSAPG